MKLDYETQQLGNDTFRLHAYFPLPGLGILPVNSFVLRGSEPILVDTGLAGQRDSFLKELGSVLDPAELRWIWMTHMDADHVGNLDAVLQAAPSARLVTTYLGMGKAGLLGLPLDRCYLLNPGQTLNAGDRALLAVKPPIFDAPETTGLFDHSTGDLFSSNSFGAVMQQPAEFACEMAAADLRDGMHLWASVDAPWLNVTDRAKFQSTVSALRELRPGRILSSHLPVAEGAACETLFSNLEDVAGMDGFVGPDQVALEQMMAAA
ncbi:MAG: MBL fold metallo-hydrolase [Planctomycetes bacterium]|nr:MBL fold metallo-hydrolase [Planctomycetota bacterium]